MNPRPAKPAAPAKRDDPAWEAAQNAPVEPEDEEERRAVEAAMKNPAPAVSGEEVTKRIAERLRTTK